MELSSHEIAALKANGQSLDVAFQIGKSGLTEGVVQELVTRLEREPLIKVKLLKSSREDADAKSLAAELAERAGAVLVEVRGHTALFYRPKRGRGRPRRSSD
ncbi:MAG TPA: YhbY family RNA-binding protein [Candidatus Thermoplasmatota archaeon]|nr:YhbY family RNA-binding protein [Candidatus Thermoplasmatota archaeon]